MIGIIDYGAGNLKSVQNALDRIGAKWLTLSAPDELERADGLILPGVGSFGEAMVQLEKHRFCTALCDWAAADRPLLGICLGQQLLFEYSEESPQVSGLGIFAGGYKKIPSEAGIKVPHIGWNSLRIQKQDGILKGLHNGAFAYFVHSYYLDAADKSIVAATTEHGVRIDAAVERGRVSACQFHPEKSGRDGQKILENFAAICAADQKGE